jgi:hypothetical protein
MNRVMLILSFIIIVLFIPACIKPVILSPTGDDAKYAATKPEEVTFSTTVPADRPYKEIGTIFSQGESWKKSLKLAREKASQLGGQAIIQGRGSASVRLTGIILFFPIFQTFYFVEGTVIRYEQ